MADNESLSAGQHPTDFCFYSSPQSRATALACRLSKQESWEKDLYLKTQGNLIQCGKKKKTLLVVRRLLEPKLWKHIRFKNEESRIILCVCVCAMCVLSHI